MKQKNKSDCVIAALASVVGLPYKAVKDRFGKLENGGMELHEIRWILSEFGEWREIRPRKYWNSKEWIACNLPKGRAIIKVMNHVVYAIDGNLYDTSSYYASSYNHHFDMVIKYVWVLKNNFLRPL